MQREKQPRTHATPPRAQRARRSACRRCDCAWQPCIKKVRIALEPPRRSPLPRWTGTGGWSPKSGGSSPLPGRFLRKSEGSPILARLVSTQAPERSRAALIYQSGFAARGCAAARGSPRPVTTVRPGQHSGARTANSTIPPAPGGPVEKESGPTAAAWIPCVQGRQQRSAPAMENCKRSAHQGCRAKDASRIKDASGVSGIVLLPQVAERNCFPRDGHR